MYLHRYKVDIIAEQRDQSEPDLILHWSIGRRSPSEWVRPEDSLLPPNSKRFDEVTVHSTFEKNVVYPEYCSLNFVI